MALVQEKIELLVQVPRKRKSMLYKCKNENIRQFYLKNNKDTALQTKKKVLKIQKDKK